MYVRSYSTLTCWWNWALQPELDEHFFDFHEQRKQANDKFNAHAIFCISTYRSSPRGGGYSTFALGTDVRPEGSTTTLQLNQRRRKFVTYV